ncbi:MAG: hypothetical protein A3F83_16320 [Candidatus Glassbacteria bacterium RIFCSPLOWO2_12_FULL_58_11]|uniref:TonB-dependent receptor plug domain-containing protein n=1 Tax=Candidatus Glassbacteria bacterium RIFCSPLOWO2_12_FULL_58_11 TaxID=1817867 RepID=A0A1F5YS86_9BACT|nr:MAG: hypothetical protein A3F83_16320 [Candidatus Glassbacteria bacterium RIFCSPLOWO2_12_FULL_58_11]
MFGFYKAARREFSRPRAHCGSRAVRFTGLLCLLLLSGSAAAQKNPAAGSGQTARNDIRGYVRDMQSEEAVPYAGVVIKGTKIGAATNADGYFVIVNAPTGKCTLQVSHIGFAVKELEIDNQPGSVKPVEIKLEQKVIEMGEITVTGQPQTVEVTGNVSQVVVDPAELIKMPNLGEIDIFRSLQLLPGISGVSDGTSGLYIRGGTPDQNLVLFDGMTIYHVDHFFGMFSAFNADAIKDIRVYQGGYPAEFGGRLSSVVNLTGKTGDVNGLRYGAGVNLLSGHGLFEIPLSGKSTLLVSGRRSYTDVVKSSLYNSIFDFMTGSQNTQPAFVNQRGRPGIGGFRNLASLSQNPDFYFYDMNAKLTYNPDSKDILALSIYRGKDNLDQTQSFNGQNFSFRNSGSNEFVSAPTLSRQTSELTDWGNTGISGKWSRKLHDRFYSSLQVSYSSYFSNYDRNQAFTGDAAAADDSTNFFRGGTTASEENNKVEDMAVTLDNEWHAASSHDVKIGLGLSRFNSHYFATLNDSVRLVSRQTEAVQNFVYLQDQWTIIAPVELTLGFRGTHYDRSASNYLEPRASLVYALSENVRLKGAWGYYHQFVNRIANENILEGSRDFWILADKDLAPNFAKHYIGGASYENGNFMFNVEGYYKDLQDLVEYSRRVVPGGPNIVDANLRGFYQGNGYAKGLDLLLQKKSGPFTGWAAYSLGKVEYTFAGLNDGNPFPASHDRTHELDLVAKYTFGAWDISSTFVYATGNPYTAPESQYYVELLDGSSQSYIHVSDKNSYRLPAYQRLDFSISRTFETSSIKYILGFSIFNLYNHKNIWYRQYNLDTQPVAITDVHMLGATPTIFLQLYSR